MRDMDDQQGQMRLAAEKAKLPPEPVDPEAIKMPKRSSEPAATPEDLYQAGSSSAHPVALTRILRRIGRPRRTRSTFCSPTTTGSCT
jgi:hypothetical protein